VNRGQQRFEHLAETCGARVLAYLARRTVPAADAADIYQEVLVIAWRRLDRVPSDEAQALAWMLGTARRCLANHRRGATRRMAATERLRETLRVVASDETEHTTAVRIFLDRLRSDDRELLTLIYWDELTIDQAALVLGIGASAARKRLQRARERLRSDLTDTPQPGGDQLVLNREGPG
jgi:RNA polymerase sigma factor (sigma-70 family)